MGWVKGLYLVLINRAPEQFLQLGAAASLLPTNRCKKKDQKRNTEWGGAQRGSALGFKEESWTVRMSGQQQWDKSTQCHTAPACKAVATATATATATGACLCRGPHSLPSMHLAPSPDPCAQSPLLTGPSSQTCKLLPSPQHSPLLTRTHLPDPVPLSTGGRGLVTLRYCPCVHTYTHTHMKCTHVGSHTHTPRPGPWEPSFFVETHTTPHGNRAS